MQGSLNGGSGRARVSRKPSGKLWFVVALVAHILWLQHNANAFRGETPKIDSTLELVLGTCD
jgi:hypothetical protein